MKKNSSNRMLPPVRLEPWTFDSMSETLLSELTWYFVILADLLTVLC